MSYGLLRRARSTPLELMELTASLGYQCTHLSFFGQIRKHRHAVQKHFGKVQLPAAWASRPSLSFEEMAALVGDLPGTFGWPGWTDLLCWRMAPTRYVNVEAL